MLEAIDKGAKRSGRRVEDLEVSTLLNTFVTNDVAAAEQDFRNVAAFYYSTPVYNKFLRWVGYEKEAAQIEEGFRRKDRNMTLGAFDSELIHKFAVIGTAEQCRDRVRAYWKAGVQTPAVNGASTNHDIFKATIGEFTPAKMAG
jgi:alkanesulfonate monooxygenase SsuD/methylene tetrahydromethanopterin reductase-like flavin-dependent oxidoreductase (luciferase family)